MSDSVRITDTRPVLVQQPRASDDSEQEKARAIKGVREIGGASGVPTKKPAK